MLAQRLKELRKLEGLTQAQLAQELGVSPSTVGMYEQGRREPDHETLSRLCACFHVTSDYLLAQGGEQEQKDLDAIIDHVRQAILSPNGLMFNGVLVERADSEKIVDAIRLGVGLVMEQKRREQGKNQAPRAEQGEP